MAAEMPGPWQGWSTADPTTRPLPAQTLGRSTPKGDEGRGSWESLPEAPASKEALVWSTEHRSRSVRESSRALEVAEFK